MRLPLLLYPLDPGNRSHIPCLHVVIFRIIRQDDGIHVLANHRLATNHGVCSVIMDA